MSYTPLTPEEIKKQYDWLVSVDHPKIIKDKKTLDYFLKMENRQEISSAYSASIRGKKNQPGFDPSKTKQEIKFQEKLHSNYITEKSRNRYLSAIAAIEGAESSGEKVTGAMKKELTQARGSISKMYSMKSITEEIKVIKNLTESELTDRQKEILKLYEERKARKSERGRDERKARGLRGKIATLSSQEDKLRESSEAFVRRTVRDGLKGWLKANPEYVRLGKDGNKLTANQQFDLYWKLLPDWEKENWAEEIEPIQKHNNKIIKKYHDLGEVVPPEVQANDLKQLHHIQPRRGRREEKFGRVRGGHFPSQTTAVKGDAFSGRKSPHGLLHDPSLDYLYAKFKDQNYMVFDFNDPNIISRESGKPEVNKKGLSYLKDVATSIMNLKGVKNVGRKMLSFIPGIGLPFQYQASKGYLSDQSLSDIAKKGRAASVWAGAPGLVGEFLVDWDKVGESHRKLLENPEMARRFKQQEEAQQWWGSIFDKIEDTLKPERKKKRESIWT
tara:strand:+ start:42 stop:1544 length:1503 start_codon:yes stop_codon:yes gene_type:complete